MPEDYQEARNKALRRYDELFAEYSELCKRRGRRGARRSAGCT